MAFADTDIKPQIHYRDGLRGWIDQVQRIGELLHVNGAHWDTEMGSITQMLTESSNNTAPAILFDEVPGYPKGFRTLYGHFSTVKRVALTLGLPLEQKRKVDIVQRFHARMQNMKSIPPRFVKDGPILQNVMEGDACDVLKFPVPRHHEQDKARFIGTADCVITQDPDKGWFNLGAYRSQVYDGKTIGCQITEGKHGRIHRDIYFERGQPMKVVILCGQDPLLFLLSGAPMPDVSEYDLAGGLRGEPIDVIRGPYTGFPIPADCEIAIEGETVPGTDHAGRPVRRMDGLLLRRHAAASLCQRQNDPVSQRSDHLLRPAAQAGRRDRIAQRHRRRRSDLARARSGRRPGRSRRLESRSRTGDALHRRADPAALSRPCAPGACISRRPARVAPTPASGTSWSTTTSMPANSTRCCGRCARGSIRMSTST